MEKKLIMDDNFFNSVVLVILLSLIINTSCQKNEILPEYETFTDSRDSEIYTYVKIGNQYWMSENLRFEPDSGKYWAYNNNESDISIHGYLYDWETANIVCPDSWHLPSKAEWTELATTLGGFNVAGGKMKTTGTLIWNSPNRDATNSCGFSALPSGIYNGYDNFSGRGNITYFWSSAVSLNIYWLSYNFGFLGETYFYLPQESASVRCVKD